MLLFPKSLAFSAGCARDRTAILDGYFGRLASGHDLRNTIQARKEPEGKPTKHRYVRMFSSDRDPVRIVTARRNEISIWLHLTQLYNRITRPSSALLTFARMRTLECEPFSELTEAERSRQAVCLR